MIPPDDVERFHERALELFDEAGKYERQGQAEKSQRLFQEAFQEEALAAELWAGNGGEEPTRGILFCSAASIALRAGEPAQALVQCNAAYESTALPMHVAAELDGIREASELELERLALLACAGDRSAFVNELGQKSVDEIERVQRNLAGIPKVKNLADLFKMEEVAEIWAAVLAERFKRRGDPLNPTVQRKVLVRQASELPQGEAYEQALDRLIGAGRRPFHRA